MAFVCFVENFDHKIRQLLYNFPVDYTNPDGSKFWVGSKRAPHAITFDVNNQLHLEFVLSYAHVIAEALSIPHPTDELAFAKNIASGFKVPEFKAKRVYIKANETDTADTNSLADMGKDEDEQITVLMNELSLTDKKQVSPTAFKPTEFEKDHEWNQHIDFIHSGSNLRAQNYRIIEVSYLFIKLFSVINIRLR
jgi:ubiquitin-activating enzyme E1